MLDFYNIPAIDTHAHSFTSETQKLNVENLPKQMYFASEKDPELQILYMHFIKEMGKYLRCNPNPKEIVKIRNSRSTDYKKYIRELYADARLEGIIIDDGYSEVAVSHALAKFDLNAFSDLTQITTRRKTRLEPLLKETIDRSSTFEEFESNFHEEVEDRVKNQGVMAIKSIIAYRTGLEIENPTSSEAKTDFNTCKENDAWTREHHFDIKRLRDYAIHMSIENCNKFKIPFVIHTGYGDVDCVIKKVSPLNLIPLLKEENTRKIKLVLIHGGYPDSEAAGWLSSCFENIYVDFSVYTPYSHANLANKLLGVLEMGPTSKVLYGSDAGAIPEGHWLSVKIFKRALSEALDKYMNFGSIDENEAYQIAERILYKNHQNVFGTNK